MAPSSRNVCVRVCLVGGGQTLTPRERPCFPYLTTAEHASPWLRAALFHGAGACAHCSLVVWCNITYVPVVSLHHPHDSAVCSTFTPFLLGCSHAPSVRPSVHPSHLPAFHLHFGPAGFQIGATSEFTGTSPPGFVTS